MGKIVFGIFLLVSLFVICSGANDEVKSNISTLKPETTAKPKTTTSKTTTTLKPTTTTKAPTPRLFTFEVKNKSGICLLAQFNLNIDVPYFNKLGERAYLSFYLNDSSPKPMYNGTCNEQLDQLYIFWPSAKWNITLNFERGVKDKSNNFALSMVKINYTLSADLFPDSNDTSKTKIVLTNASLFTCPVGSYWKCVSKQSLVLTDPSSTEDVPKNQQFSIAFSELRVEAFRSGNNETFLGTMQECSADHVTSKVVPIVVGVVLAIMIVIALVVFIIGSRRRQLGYQQI